RVGDALPDRRSLVGVELLEVRDVPEGHDHEVAAAVRVGVEDRQGRACGVAPHDVGLFVGEPAREDFAENAAVAVPRRDSATHLLDVLPPPAGPQPPERTHAEGVPESRSSTSARSRARKSSRGTPRSAPSFSRELTPTVPAATSSAPTTST